MNRKLLLLFAVLFLVPLSASAQVFDPEHRNGLEINAGLSPVQVLLQSYKSEEGLEGRNMIMPCCNISYVFSFNDVWAIVAGVNIAASRFKLTGPDGKPAGTEMGRIEPSGVASVRLCWGRKENYTLYSSFGVGMDPKILLASFFPTPIPNIVPLGVAFGKGKFYGLSELVLGSSSSGVIFGIGCHL